MKRVFILASSSLFGQGVSSLLSQEPDLHIVGQDSDPGRALSRVQELQPDVVILCNEPEHDTLLTLLPDVIRENQGTTVIGLSLYEETLYIYRAMRQKVKSIEELVEVINQE